MKTLIAMCLIIWPMGASATTLDACRAYAPLMAKSNDAASVMAIEFGGVGEIKDQARDLLGGDEGKAMAAYFSASEELTAALKKFLKVSRAATVVIENCADQ